MAPTAADKVARDTDFDRADAVGRLHGLDMTAVLNMVGQCPALSVPSGLGKPGLPTAVQIVTDRFGLALRIGAAIEKLRAWSSWSPAAG